MQKKLKGIKKVLKIFSIAIISLLIVLFLASMLLNNGFVQDRFRGSITNLLSEKLDAKVEVGDIDFLLFNRLRLNNLYLEDQHKDTLLYTNKLTAHFNPWKLLSKELVFSSVNIDGLNANVELDENGIPNFKFIIDAFKSDKKRNKKSSEPIVLKIKSIKIENSNLSYRNASFAKHNIPELPHFNGNDILLNNFKLELSLGYLKGDSIRANITKLSFDEQSGLSVNDLKTEVTGMKRGLLFPYFNIKLPHTEFRLDSVKLAYDSISDFSHFVDRVMITARIRPSNFVPKDLMAFVPNFKNMQKQGYIAGDIRGRVNNFKISDFNLKYGKSIELQSNVDINGIDNIEETFIYTDIKKLNTNSADLQDFISGITNQPFKLPKELYTLGKVKYRGNITGFFSNLVSYGSISTNLGNLKTDISIQLTDKMRALKYSGRLIASNFQLGRMLNSSELGKTSFSISTQGGKPTNGNISGEVNGTISNIDFKKYSYKKISLNGMYDSKGFDGLLSVDDPNVKAEFGGVMDFSKSIPTLLFTLDVNRANIDTINLVKRYPNSLLSFKGSVNLAGNSIDDMNGIVEFDSIKFVNKKDSIVLKKLSIESRKNRNKTKLILSSDVVNGNFEGEFNYSTIYNSVKTMLSNYLPALWKTDIINKNNTAKSDKNSLDFQLKISNSENITKTLELPIKLNGLATIRGRLNDTKNSIYLNLGIPNFFINDMRFENLNLALDNVDKNNLNLIFSSDYLLKNDTLKLNLNSKAYNNRLNTNIDWENSNTIKYSGKLHTQTLFNRDENSKNRTIKIDFLPTNIVLKDSIWNINRATVNVENDSTIKVNRFKIDNKGQFVIINGELSKSEDRALNIDINDMNIAFFISLINLDAIELDGNLSGSAELVSALKQPKLQADLTLKRTIFNGSYMGDTKLNTSWDNIEKKINVSAKFSEDNTTTGLVEGSYRPSDKNIDFSLDADNINIGFLQKWLDSILKNIEGRGFGKLRINGNPNDLAFEGDVYVKRGKMMVDFLKSTFSFSDSVHLKKGKISFDNITFFDTEKNSGKLNGFIEYKNIFKEMKYDISVDAKNIIALNTTVKDNDTFFGKAYATGAVSISGEDGNTLINVDVKTEPKSDVNIMIGGASKTQDNSFITFVNNYDSLSNDRKKEILNHRHKGNMVVNLMLDIAPSASIHLIINPQTGDMISANGSGNLRLEYDNKFNSFKMYGNYAIERGKFLFTLQEFIRKEFTIENGSKIVWTGDMLGAMLDIKAIYSVTASLRDLMNMDLISSSSGKAGRTSVPVNCVLNIKNQLMHPDISFDIDLPSSDEPLKMQVKSLINTQEMLNRQMVSLLLLNKFYTPQYAGQTANNNNGDTGWAFIMSTLSGPINNMLSKVSNNVSFGVNYRSSGYGQELSQEYEAEVIVQPNSRLIVNGNFGYRDDMLANNKIIGDVDVEYILTENRKWRLKVYNHTVDRYSLRSSPFIQGVGVMYKEDFNTWKELWDKLLRKRISTNSTVHTDSIKTPNK